MGFRVYVGSVRVSDVAGDEARRLNPKVLKFPRRVRAVGFPV